MAERTCSLDGCARPHYARGWCNMHWQRLRRHGDPSVVKTGGPPSTPQPPCSIEGCDRPHYGRGWCRPHWQRWSRTGDPLMTRPRVRAKQPERYCQIEGCDGLHYGRGWCRVHYKRWHTYGSPHERDLPRQLENRLWPRIDKDGPGGCWLYTAYTDTKGYGKIVRDGKAVFVHRVVYELLVGPIPDGLEIDHCCRVTACCNPEHLEPVTHAENLRRSVLSPEEHFALRPVAGRSAG